MEYHNLGVAFSKQRLANSACSPLHRPSNCASIQGGLLPGATLPLRCLYNLTKVEQEDMESYIGKSGVQVDPSLFFPGRASFSFVQKEDGSLWLNRLPGPQRDYCEE